MSKRAHRLLFLITLTLLCITIPVSAQSTGWATLSLANIESFPQITAYLDVYDGEGNFVHDLTTEDVRAVENGREIPPTQLTESNNGAQFVVAINMGPVYAIKNEEGLSRYELIDQRLRRWIDEYPAQTNDDLSLLTNDGTSDLHLNQPVAWLSSFQDYQPDFEASLPSLNVLADAIVVASDSSPRKGMGRGVLLITPLPGEDSLGILPSLLEMANQGNVRVYLWVVSSKAYFDSERAARLDQFAAETGGRTFYFSGDETLPDVEAYIDPLRYTYTLTYQSQISSGDKHQLAAHINVPGLDVTTDPVEFGLSVQPPNPIFVTPPLEIQRSPASMEVATDEGINYEPDQQTLEIVVEFPDGQPRPLERTVLYVDGEIAEENLAPPFDRFSWDLSPYQTTGSHLLQVEAIDTLGLSGTSIEHEVDVRVSQPRQNFFAAFQQYPLILIGIALVLTAGIVVLVFLQRGKIQPRITGRLSKEENGKRQQQSDREAPVADPKPAPAEAKVSKNRFSQWIDRFSWPRREGEESRREAHLIVVNGGGEQERIPLNQSELTFGSDKTLSTITLEDSSVAPLHARIRKQGDERYQLSDEGSPAGTWVNYEPLGVDSYTLSHGDIIHIGRVRFGFRQSESIPLPQLKITAQEAS